MKKLVLLSFLFLLTSFVFAQKFDTWNEFAKTKFEPKYDEQLGEYLYYPTFPQKLMQLVGKEISLEGYYVPFAPENESYIILSKFPMSQCFFCGGGGPESVAEVSFRKKTGPFAVDDLIKVKGKLKLNTDDIDHVNFILTEAVLITE